jgi:hypothetical protein
MRTSPGSQERTRVFARVLGPFFFIVPAVIAIRAGEMGILLSNFIEKPIWAWVLGAFLLFGGIFIIAFHQYWRSPSAVVISLLGWFLGLRGLLLLIAPQLIVYGSAAAMSELRVVRVGFGALSLVGLWLTFVGWRVKQRN